MKKLTFLAAIAATATSFANADTVLGVYAGFGSWDASYDGKIGDPTDISLKELGVKDHKNSFYYVALEHPIPIIPNIRLAHTEISRKQTATISRSFEYGDVMYSANDTVKSEFDLTHTDVTLYYEILDNWVNLDLGLTARMFDGFVYAASTTNTSKNKKEKVDETLPMLYAKAQFDLPLTGLSVGVEGNYVSYSGDKVTDYSAKVSYLFDSVLDVGLEAGYRKLSVTVDEDDLKANVDIKGPYAAVIAHF